MATRFREYALAVFDQIQPILAGKPQAPVLFQVVAFRRFEDAADPCALFAGLSGLLRTARIENSHLTCQFIEVGAHESALGLVEKLSENARTPWDERIRYEKMDQGK